MLRHKTFAITIYFSVFALVVVIYILRAVNFRQTHYQVGQVPAEIAQQLLPKDIPLAALRPPALRSQDPIRFGGTTSVISVIEYGDFECPYCRQITPILLEMAQPYGGQVRFVWRDFAIPEIHPTALPAAIFARCAGLQGKYWEAHDALMSADSLKERGLDSIAKKLNLDETQLDACRRTPAVGQAILRDVEEARADGIKNAPLIFVGAQAFESFTDTEALRQAIEKALTAN
jgi:protein-disulfide isomerase